LRKQRIVPGRLAPAYEAELGRLRAQQVITRLWNREPALWKDDAAHAGAIANRLGWLSVVDQMRSEAANLTAFSEEVSAAGLRNLVLLGMGGSSLAPEVFSLLFPPSGGRRFFVLDTTDPESLRAVQRLLEPERTLFIVASKSGSTIETLSQFQYFLDQLQRAGISQAGKHFIAITDAGSHLDKLAQEHGFRRVFRNPTDIGGRYSALSFFGLVPAALWGIDVNAILDSASEMMAATGPQAPPETNPALRLAALLGAGAMQGCDKLFLLSPRSVEPLGNWIEQLVAESTGKEGRGIVPIVGGPDTPIELLEQGAITVALTLDGHDDAALNRTIAELEQRGAPMAEIRMAAPADLGAEFFRWEVATVIAGVALSIDPFDEPNVQESKDATARLLREFESTGSMPQGSLVLAESGIELYTEAAAPGAGKALQISDVLRAFLAERRAGNYLALLAYVARDAENAAELEGLRLRLADRLQMPVLLGYGPRYLHSIGQLYKGGPPSGLFAIITSRKAEELPIPGARFTFAQLQTAQALGDMQRLAQRNRPVVRLHLAQGARPGLAALRGIFEQALATPVAPAR
jgi:glucose-6-phosphate isomerase/transaldolase/glucose-6-phosphate isomerase